MRLISIWLALLIGSPLLFGADKDFSFAGLKDGAIPPGWRPALTGGGGPVKWGIVQDDVPSELERFSALAPNVNVRPVMAQLSQDKTDERFPMLIYDEEEYGNFKLTTKFKTLSGEMEQMAGIAFRIVDEKNYHVIRASSKGGTFLFYSFINGQRTQPVGVNIAIASNVWHTLEIDATGTRFVFRLDGKDVMPPLDNPNFRRGKIGYWTKSDSVSYFVDTRIEYKEHIIQAQRQVDEAMKQFDRLIALRIVVPGDAPKTTRILASSIEDEIDQPGIAKEMEVIKTGKIMYLRENKQVTVTLPLRDRNGDPIAAVRVTMERFPGQTQKNAIIRAQPVVANVQKSILGLESLTE